jgi:hypothetical protein
MRKKSGSEDLGFPFVCHLQRRREYFSMDLMYLERGGIAITN